MANLNSSWVCLLVNHNFLRRRNSSVEQEMRDSFEGDFIDFDMAYDGSEETYAFVKCLDYHSHINRLRHSPAIKSVLSSFDSPCFLSDSEVKDFIVSATPKIETGEFKTGDVVLVKKGVFANLVGIVLKPAKKKSHYSIAFKFHIRHFHESIPASDLHFVDNIFRVIRVPVTTPAKGRPKQHTSPHTGGREKLCNERIQNRAAHRKCKRGKY